MLAIKGAVEDLAVIVVGHQFAAGRPPSCNKLVPATMTVVIMTTTVITMLIAAPISAQPRSCSHRVFGLRF
jgi:hypothetical protein